MAFGDISGRARTNPRNPSAFGVCDSCGIWYNLNTLRWQYEWAGTTLINLGQLVCPDCYDKPQDQLRAIILPPDPVPRLNPRPESFPMDDGLQGFTQYVLDPVQSPPQTKSDVLGAVAALSGVPTPGGVVDRSGTLTTANIGQAIMAANPARSWLLIYGPSQPQLQFAVSGTVVWSSPTNLPLGPGGAWFWSTAQGGAAAYTGALAIIGLIAGTAFYAWEA